jgi:hypothetical protein
MADFTIKKRDAKTGNKKERIVVKLSKEQVNAGSWTRGAGGSAHHFFIDGTSICGRRETFINRQGGTVRLLCADCYAAVNRATNAIEVF